MRSAVINAHGALILCSEPIPEGTPSRNEKTGKRVEASLVWTGGAVAQCHDTLRASAPSGLAQGLS